MTDNASDRGAFGERLVLEHDTEHRPRLGGHRTQPHDEVAELIVRRCAFVLAPERAQHDHGTGGVREAAGDPVGDAGELLDVLRAGDHQQVPVGALVPPAGPVLQPAAGEGDGQVTRPWQIYQDLERPESSQLQ